MQKGLQQQLRPSLLVIEPFHPVFGIFAEELLKLGEQLAHVQAAIGQDVPGGLPGGAFQIQLRDGGQFARDDLAVNSVGNFQPARASRYQAQINDILNFIRQIGIGVQFAAGLIAPLVLKNRFIAYSLASAAGG